MSLSLKKEEEQVRLNLKKKSIDRQFQVELLVDVSGSARPYFNKGGFYEAALQRSMAFASVVDPDGQIQITPFSDSVGQPQDYNVSQFEHIREDFLANTGSDVLWGGGTEYHKAFKPSNQKRQENLGAVQRYKNSLMGSLKSLFSRAANSNTETVPESEKKVYPRLIIFQTDGENYGGYANFIKALEETVADGQTFVTLLGVGSFNSGELQSADDAIEGVSFVPCRDIKTISNEAFYELLLTDEFVSWMNTRPAV